MNFVLGAVVFASGALFGAGLVLASINKDKDKDNT